MGVCGRAIVLAVGGAAGVNARYWLGLWINRRAGTDFPWSTFAINVSGSFAIGLLSALLAGRHPHSHARLLVLVGFLGGYTTFSAYAIESLILLERGDYGRALANLFGSLGAGMIAVALGVGLGRALVALGEGAGSPP